jgi:hypothetical protein
VIMRRLFRCLFVGRLFVGWVRMFKVFKDS